MRVVDIYIYTVHTIQSCNFYLLLHCQQFFSHLPPIISSHPPSVPSASPIPSEPPGFSGWDCWTLVFTSCWGVKKFHTGHGTETQLVNPEVPNRKPTQAIKLYQRLLVCELLALPIFAWPLGQPFAKPQCLETWQGQRGCIFKHLQTSSSSSSSPLLKRSTTMNWSTYIKTTIPMKTCVALLQAQTLDESVVVRHLSRRDSPWNHLHKLHRRCTRIFVWKYPQLFATSICNVSGSTWLNNTSKTGPEGLGDEQTNRNLRDRWDLRKLSQHVKAESESQTWLKNLNNSKVLLR